MVITTSWLGALGPATPLPRRHMPAVSVVRTYLELTAPEQLRPADNPDATLHVERSDGASAVALSRELYRTVGADYYWRDRLSWSDEQLAAYLALPAVSVWVLYAGNEPAGFFELRAHNDGSVEIVYFGLLQRYMGRGAGKFLLTRAAEEAWRLGAERVWLHTCTLDSPAALPNYLARGFSPFRTETYTAQLPDA